MKDNCQPDFDDHMILSLPVDVSLEGGSILVEVAGGTKGVKLTRLVTDMLASREGPFDRILQADLAYLAEVQHELALAASLVASRIAAERAHYALLEGQGKVEAWAG